MNKSSIDENKAIQEGLERFLDAELLPQQNIKELKTEFATPVGRPRAEAPKQAEERRLEAEPPRQQEENRPKAERPAGQQERRLRAERPAEREERRPKREESRQEEPRRREKRRPEKKAPQKQEKHKRKKKTPHNKKEQKKPSKWKKFLVVVFVLAVIVFAAWYSLVGKIYKQMNYEKVQGLASEPMKQDGVINVLLIGNDSRENSDDGRSDAMILLSVSNETKTIHMTSLLRDMYVDIPGHDGNRLNAAYAYGGPALLCETIEQNFGIEVNRYVLVNFQAFAALVDAVGGIDMEVTNEEVQWINAYLNEYNMLEGREMTTDYLDTSLSGEIHLNGPQALAYSRNRYIGTDFGRTERQRKVLSAVIGKLPVAFATGGDELMNELLPNLTTNLTQMEMFGLSGNAGKLLTYEIVQTVIPAEGTYSNASIRGMSVLEVDFEANKQIIQKEIYGKE